MAGQIKRMIDEIADKRCNGIEAIRLTTIVKITLKGVNVGKYTADSPDDPEMIARLKTIAREMGVAL